MSTPDRGVRTTGARALVVAVVVALAAVGVAGPAAGVDATTPGCTGAAGIGDPYFPADGNGGYDVGHYYLDLQYEPALDHLTGVARIKAQATQDLCRFNLDLSGLTVRAVVVDGLPATWARTGEELVITPARRVLAGRPFTVVVRYDGVPQPLGEVGLEGGFLHTDDGALVAGQPESASAWFPANDHPLDKATYTFEVTVPDGLSVLANGLPQVRWSLGGRTTEIWYARSPMASYLATLAIGRWDIRRRTTAAGLPIIDAVDPRVGTEADAALALQEPMLAFLADTFGPYPFETAGAIVDDHLFFFALETQTRPVYPRLFFEFGGGPDVVVHELAHQWFGNSVALARWQDIWLNEGFATYAEWLWAEHRDQATADQIFATLYDELPAGSPFWALPIGDPGPEGLFDEAVYYRGAMTLHALRQAIGDADFFALLRQWAEERAGGHGTTAQFIALAEATSGRQVDDLFEAWLFAPVRPPRPAGPAVAAAA